MTPQETEELYIRLLDASLPPEKKELLTKALTENSSLAKSLETHTKIREALQRTTPASFGPYFAARIAARIENTGVLIERQIFSFFKKYQLVAAGVIVALLVLNTVFAEQTSIDATFGLENTTSTESTSTTTTTAQDEIVSFDFYKTLNNDL